MFRKIIADDELICGVIQGGFSKCDEVIDYCERTGYEAALIRNELGESELDKTLRLAQKCRIPDTYQDEIFRACLPFLPTDSCTPVGLSRMHVVKYEPGNYFKKHYDECYQVDNKWAELTVIVYLNDNFEGGETIFHELDKEYVYKPTKGDIVIFDHDYLHEGCIVREGSKYIIRCDVLFA